jgi:radical S-adenosyl methionine domain-containing protein 2
MKCKFCYATFEEFEVKKQLSLKEIFIVLDKLKQNGVQKVTFAGGEPMLYKKLDEVIIYAKNIGLTTSIITNGTLLSLTFLNKMKKHLDWIGLSVDSLYKETNEKIGRVTKKPVDYYSLVTFINAFGYKLKINTVVNIHNQKEILNHFIEYSKTTRWKVFDTLRVEGQNHTQFEEIKSSNFKGFVESNKHPSMVVEDNELMTGSYLLIDPLGRLYENSLGKHVYSDSLITNTFEHCMSQINLDREMFERRGGIYEW